MTPERQVRLLNVIDKRQPDLGVVLENVFDPHNVSAVMRTCDAVGVQDVFILNTKFPRHKKWGFKSSSSAKKWLTVHQFENIEECFAVLRRRYERIYATHLSDNAFNFFEMDLTQNVALIFGNEHSGVTDEIRRLTDGNFIIPQVGVIRSLNISVACAITLYEAFRQKTIAGHYERNNADCGYKAAIKKQWEVG